MKRDLDLCREILRQIEDGSADFYMRLSRIEGRSEDEVRYQATILREAGLLWSLKGHQHPNQCDPTTDRYRLTWAGHEFLDAARDNTRWNSAKRKVLDTTGGLAFEFSEGIADEQRQGTVGAGLT